MSDEDKKLEDWIHGRVVIETDEPDQIEVRGPVQPDGHRRSVIIGMTPEERKYLNYVIPRKGPKRNAIVSGLKRALKTTAHVAGWTLVGTATALIKGQSLPISLMSGAAAASGGAILSLAGEKAVKEYGKKTGQKSRLRIIFNLVAQLFVLLLRKEPK